MSNSFITPLSERTVKEKKEHVFDYIPLSMQSFQELKLANFQQEVIHTKSKEIISRTFKGSQSLIYKEDQDVESTQSSNSENNDGD